MQVTHVTIVRRPSYDLEFPNQLIGHVGVKSSEGSQEVRLCKETIDKVFSAVWADGSEAFLRNARLAAGALTEVTVEAILAAGLKTEASS